MSASVTGRRYARRARVDRIVFAQPLSAAMVFGSHTKILRRLGESPASEGLYGPTTSTLLNALPMRLSEMLTLAAKGLMKGNRAVSSMAAVNLMKVTFSC